MIGQYLSNTNKNAIVFQKNFVEELNTAYVSNHYGSSDNYGQHLFSQLVMNSYKFIASYAVAASSLLPPNAKPGYLDQIFNSTP